MCFGISWKGFWRLTSSYYITFWHLVNTMYSRYWGSSLWQEFTAVNQIKATSNGVTVNMVHWDCPPRISGNLDLYIGMVGLTVLHREPFFTTNINSTTKLRINLVRKSILLKLLISFKKRGHMTNHPPKKAQDFRFKIMWETGKTFAPF